MSCTTQTDIWIFQASFKKTLPQQGSRYQPPALRQLDSTDSWDEPTPVSRKETNYSSQTRNVLLRNSRVSKGLKTLEEDLIEIKEAEEDRKRDVPNDNTRYPYELVVLGCLFTIALGALLGALRGQEIRKRRELADRISVVELRLAAHVRDVSEDSA